MDPKQTKVCTDEQLLESLAGGNDKAFDLLFKKYLHKLFLFANDHTNDPEFARELVMDVMMRLWQKRNELHHISSLQAYLYSSVKHAIIDNYRKKALQLTSLEELHHASAGRSQADYRLLDQELQRTLQEGVQQLSPQRRLIFEMKREQNLSNKEIAERLELSPKTVENHMTAAISFLKSHFEKNADLAISLLLVLSFTA